MSAEIGLGSDRDSGNEQQNEPEEFESDIGSHTQRVGDGGDHTEPLEDFQIQRHRNWPPWCLELGGREYAANRHGGIAGIGRRVDCATNA